MISLDEAADLAASAFRRVGVTERDAGAASELLVLAEAMGIKTHGLNRVPDYVTRILAGGIDPSARCIVDRPAPTLCHVDGNNGLGPAVARCALEAAMDAARAAGIGGAFVRNSSHIGALAPLLYLAAEAGFAAIITTNTAPMIAPAGGRAALLGNNPMGLAMPHPDGRHVLVDMALSVVSRSRVRAALRSGHTIPDDWATDADGRPTENPAEAMTGLMRAIGGNKGAVLALGLDLFAGVLSGAGCMSKIPAASRAPEKPQGLGQMFLLIDTARLLSEDVRRARLNEAADLVTTSAPLDPDYPVRMPGTRALDSLRAAKTRGLAISADLLSELRAPG